VEVDVDVAVAVDVDVDGGGAAGRSEEDPGAQAPVTSAVAIIAAITPASGCTERPGRTAPRRRVRSDAFGGRSTGLI
jgi:hypothetical protein